MQVPSPALHLGSKDLAVLQQHRSKLLLGSGPWLGNSICCRVAPHPHPRPPPKKKKNWEKVISQLLSLEQRRVCAEMCRRALRPGEGCS